MSEGLEVVRDLKEDSHGEYAVQIQRVKKPGFFHVGNAKQF